MGKILRVSVAVWQQLGNILNIYFMEYLIENGDIVNVWKEPSLTQSDETTDKQNNLK